MRRLTPDDFKKLEKLQELQDSFDKKYIEDLFDTGENLGLWMPGKRQNYQYQHNNNIYTISRIRIPKGSVVKIAKREF